MKNHLVFKFLAVLLCSLMLLSALACTATLVTFAAMGINDNYTVEDAYQSETADLYSWSAYSVAQRYASRVLGKCPQVLIDSYYGSRVFSSSFRQNQVFYTIGDEAGHLLETTVPDRDDLISYTVKVPSVRYMKLVATDNPVHVITVEDSFAAKSEEAPDEQIPDAMMRNANTFDLYDEDGGQVVYHYIRDNSPSYVVTLYCSPNALLISPGWNALRLAWNYRTQLIFVLGFSLLLLAISAVYLCTVAGRKPGSDAVAPMGLNRMPIDMYFVIMGITVSGIVALVLQLSEYLISRDFQVMLACILYGSYAACLLFVGFCYCFAAQIKTPGHYLWRNSLTGRLLAGTVKLTKWSWRHVPGFLASGICGGVRLLQRIFKAIVTLLQWLVYQLKRPIIAFWNAFHRLLHFLPLIWQWMLVTCVVGFCLILTIILDSPVGIIAVLVCAFIIVLYGAWAFGTLLEGAQRMQNGNLEDKIDERYMIGGFRDFGSELNGLADVAVVAAQKQLKSERMKTELITNVSHDIKTPLTSIINFVDLLENPHTPEQEKQYLEVLHRQSQRMKKLVDDLMEMSKASSGNMSVDLIAMDAAEAVNQALGEFSDKLEKASLTPVFHHPGETITLLADGRLMWRCMSNVLSNAVKYALPGTRLYIDLSIVEGKAVISFKNISREQLNISADELLERFVRGDASRNTEGSGLGLNIAKSLMELQHGKLDLLVDGDLFKVTLIFPMA